MLSEKDVRILAEWNSREGGPATIRLRSGEDPRSGLFRFYCEEIVAAAPKIEVRMETAPPGELPAFLVGAPWSFHALPRENELEPFLNILSLSRGGEQPSLDKSIPERLRRIGRDMDFKIFVAPECPFCPVMVQRIAPLPLLHSRVRLRVVDAALFGELAESDGVKSVPTLFLNDRFRWTGEVGLPEILASMEYQDPSRLEPEVFKNMLKEGQAGRLAALMIEKGAIFPGFLELLYHPEWSVRLGAMVVVEDLAETDNRLARKILEPLWRSVHNHDESVRGDLLYLIGAIGADDPKLWVERLASLLERESNDDVRETIGEAISKLREGDSEA